MTNIQPYREPLAVDVALTEIDAKTGSHFDPQVVSMFVAMHGSRQAASPILSAPARPHVERCLPPIWPDSLTRGIYPLAQARAL